MLLRSVATPRSTTTQPASSLRSLKASVLVRQPKSCRQHRVVSQVKSTEKSEMSAEEQQAIQDVVAAARLRVSQVAVAPPPPQRTKPAGPVNEFVFKVQAAWRIFFPPKPADMTPKDEGKKRLRMILVADRCGMNQSSLFEMKHSIVQVVSEFVEVEGEEMVDVNVSADGEQGTIYTVSVPVRRVKPQARLPLEGDADTDGVTMEWEKDDPDADPSARFPFGC